MDRSYCPARNCSASQEWGKAFPKSHVFFFLFFFFYHAFIVCRYKKLRAALAMERTKPINHNKQEKKPTTFPPQRVKNLSSLKPFGYRSSPES